MAAQVVVTVDQVLQVLAEFFRKQERERFVLDQGFSFLRLLACHSSRTEILATYQVLQYRTTVASKHLMREINSLMPMYGAEADKMSISSYESSILLFRSLFGNGSARKEVGRWLARPEYLIRCQRTWQKSLHICAIEPIRINPNPKGVFCTLILSAMRQRWSQVYCFQEFDHPYDRTTSRAKSCSEWRSKRPIRHRTSRP